VRLQIGTVLLPALAGKAAEPKARALDFIAIHGVGLAVTTELLIDRSGSAVTRLPIGT
jgi:hypothetical protein